MEPLLSNDRAKREWAWIVERVGEEAARAAIARLPGARKPYPLNIARVLGLRLPAHLAEEPTVPMPPEVRQKLRALREELAGRKRSA